MISYHIDGELKPKKAQQVALHLKECYPCSEVYKDFLDVSRMVREGHQHTVEKFRKLQGNEFSPELKEAIAKQSKGGQPCTRHALEELVTRTGFACNIISREDGSFAVYGRTFINGDEFGVWYILRKTTLVRGPVYCLNKKETQTVPVRVKAKAEQLDRRIRDYLAKREK